jgi:hypothetical protein
MALYFFDSSALVIALCATIVKDVSGVAELKPQTRQSYRTAIQGTLAAFRPRSRLPDKTQSTRCLCGPKA